MTAPRPYRVLVVCTGNTCRSAMAGALLARMFEEAEVLAEVRSAGTAGLAGGPAHPHARAVAAEAGLDLSGHVSRPLTPEILEWADTVIAMQPSHVHAAHELDSAADVRLITDLAPGKRRAGIRDPIGWDRDVYREVFEEMRGCLEPFVEAQVRTRVGGAG